METIWIIGGGRVGQYAAKVFNKISSAEDIIVVDNQPTLKLPEYTQLIYEDALSWFTREFTHDNNISKIIPALPVHLAAEWIKKKLAEEKADVQSVALSEALLEKLPHPFQLKKDQFAISHADFLCPTGCSEPDIICSYTKKRRPQPLFSILAEIDSTTFTPCIVRSRQFGPSLGGFLPEDLWDLLQSVKKHPDTPVLIGTACKCHGIVDGISFHPGDNTADV